MEIYEFHELKKEARLKTWPQILLFMPFSFTFQNYDHEANERYKELLTDFKDVLDQNGLLWIVDIEWIKHAMVDGLAFMMTGEFSKMAMTFVDIKNLMVSAGFENVRKIGSSNGIMIISAEKKK